MRGSDTRANDNFGDALARSGTTFVAGAWGHASGAGRGYVFTSATAGWEEVAELKGSDTTGGYIGDDFGNGVALSSNTLVVGAPEHGASGEGRAYLFAKAANGWHQIAEFQPDGHQNGPEGFGEAVAISGNTIVVGAPGDATGAGRIYLIRRTSTGWRHVARLKGSDTTGNAELGDAVDL